MEGNKLDREIGFIAKYYKAGLFNTERTLRKIKPAVRKIWSWQRIAVASCIFIVIAASAALFILNPFYSEKTTDTENIITPQIPLEAISKVIDFDDTPLPIVIQQINSVYNVEVTNLPDDADNYRLSLHYEGNVVDLIETINEILGINLQIEK